MENVPSDALVHPSVTVIVMFGKYPGAVGVPLRTPVVELSVAQAGSPVIEYVSVPLLPAKSFAVGRNE